MNKSAIYTTETGVHLPCTTTEEPGPDGRVYVIFAQGGQGNVDASRVRYVEDKDAPRAGMEYK